MEILSAATGKEWVQTSAEGPADPKITESLQANNQRLQQMLTEILLSENLVVLAGLGATLYIQGQHGSPGAPTMPELWDGAAKLAGTEFAEIQSRAKYTPPPEGNNIEVLLSQCLLAQRFSPSEDVRKFVDAAEALIVERCRFVNPDSTLTFHESLLRKVARRDSRKPRLKLFTTNYDLAFETAASHVRFIAVDGFSHTQPQEFDGSHFSYDFVKRAKDNDVPDFLPNVFQLYKLHGSVDWELFGTQITKTIQPAKPLLIYPRSSKFESAFDQPFIELMSRFQLSLRESNTGLIVIGFGFNDNHIVQPIMSAIRSNVGLKAAIVSPSLKNSPKKSVNAIKSLIQEGDHRLSLINARFEDLVPVLPDLVTETEEERHRARLRANGEKP